MAHTDNVPTPPAAPEGNLDVREALARTTWPLEKSAPPFRVGYPAADAILAAFAVRPHGTVTDQGAWVCAKCGGSSPEHSLTTSTCLWEPQWRGAVPAEQISDAEVQAAGAVLYGPEAVLYPPLIRRALEAAREVRNAAH